MDLEILKTRKRLIVHANCADGIASAMIIRDVLPDIEVVEVQYGTEQHRTLTYRSGDIFCDISPHWAASVIREEMGDVVVLDHHKNARDIVKLFPRGVFADEEKEPGVSGAMLAYREVWQPLRDPRIRPLGHGPQFASLVIVARKVGEFAVLAGMHDTWQRDDPQWEDACAQAAALRFFGLHHFIDHPSGLRPFTHWEREGALETGRLLYQKALETAKKQAEAVWVLDGVAYLNSLDTNDVAEELRTSGSEAKMLAGFAFKTDPTTGEIQLVWSLRSIAPGVDVGTLAKVRGGGGHTRAAGFTEKGMWLDGTWASCRLDEDALWLAGVLEPCVDDDHD